LRTGVYLAESLAETTKCRFQVEEYEEQKDVERTEIKKRKPKDHPQHEHEFDERSPT